MVVSVEEAHEEFEKFCSKFEHFFICLDSALLNRYLPDMPILFEWKEIGNWMPSIFTTGERDRLLAAVKFKFGAKEKGWKVSVLDDYALMFNPTRNPASINQEEPSGILEKI